MSEPKSYAVVWTADAAEFLAGVLYGRSVKHVPNEEIPLFEELPSRLKFKYRDEAVGVLSILCLKMEAKEIKKLPDISDLPELKGGCFGI